MKDSSSIDVDAEEGSRTVAAMGDGGEEAASVVFPQARVKKIMKTDKDVGTISQEALLRMTCTAVFSFQVWLNFSFLSFAGGIFGTFNSSCCPDQRPK